MIDIIIYTIFYTENKFKRLGITKILASPWFSVLWKIDVDFDASWNETVKYFVMKNLIYEEDEIFNIPTLKWNSSQRMRNRENAEL